MKLGVVLGLMLISRQMMAQYMKAEDQPYYRNDSNDGKNNIERIDSSVKEINKLWSEINSLKDEIAQMKKEMSTLKNTQFKSGDK